jgi:hypothetical protein
MLLFLTKLLLVCRTQPEQVLQFRCTQPEQLVVQVHQFILMCD